VFEQRLQRSVGEACADFDVEPSKRIQIQRLRPAPGASMRSRSGRPRMRDGARRAASHRSKLTSAASMLSALVPEISPR
jgi:hypothetical protein